MIIHIPVVIPQNGQNTIVAVRGTYHLTILAEKNNKFDPYAGVVLGLRFNSYKDTYDDYFYNTYGYHYEHIAVHPLSVEHSLS